MAAAFAAAPRIILQKRGHIHNNAHYRRAVVATSSAKDDVVVGGGDEGGEESRLLRHVKALLSADDVACKQILSSPEGKALLEMSNHTAAMRMVKLRDALPVRNLDVMAMVIEQPSLLTFEGDYNEVGENKFTCEYIKTTEENAFTLPPRSSPDLKQPPFPLCYPSDQRKNNRR